MGVTLMVDVMDVLHAATVRNAIEYIHLAAAIAFCIPTRLPSPRRLDVTGEVMDWSDDNDFGTSGSCCGCCAGVRQRVGVHLPT